MKINGRGTLVCDDIEAAVTYDLRVTVISGTNTVWATLEFENQAQELEMFKLQKECTLILAGGQCVPGWYHGPLGNGLFVGQANVEK